MNTYNPAGNIRTQSFNRAQAVKDWFEVKVDWFGLSFDWTEVSRVFIEEKLIAKALAVFVLASVGFGLAWYFGV